MGAFDEPFHRVAPAGADLVKGLAIGKRETVGLMPRRLGEARLVARDFGGVAVRQIDEPAESFGLVGKAGRVIRQNLLEAGALLLALPRGVFDVEAERLAQRQSARGNELLHLGFEDGEPRRAGMLDRRLGLGEGGLQLHDRRDGARDNRFQ